MKIAIIGTGFTGLAAASEFLSKGHNVEVFEESGHIGGLASTFPTHGTYLESTYHHIFESQNDILTLLDELGLHERVQWGRLTTGVFIKGHLYPFTSPFDLLRFSPLPFPDRIRMGIATLLLRGMGRWHDFSSVSAQQWICRWAGKRAYRVVWEPLLRGKFHEHFSQISMMWLWNRLRVRSERVAYIQGSLKIVFEALQKRLEDHRATVHFNTSIDGISSDDSGAHLSIRGRSDCVSFDRVLCTVPSPVFARMIERNPLPPDYIHTLLKTGNLGSVCLVFSSSQSLSPFYWTNINDEKSPFIVCIQHTNLVPSSQFRGENFYYLNAYVPLDDWRFLLDEAQITEKYLSYLSVIFPAFRRDKVTETHLSRIHYAQHIAVVGYEKIIYPHKTPIPRVYLANFSQIFPKDRSMNCAVKDGKEVARMMMSDL